MNTKKLIGFAFYLTVCEKVNICPRLEIYPRKLYPTSSAQKKKKILCKLRKLNKQKKMRCAIVMRSLSHSIDSKIKIKFSDGTKN